MTRFLERRVRARMCELSAEAAGFAPAVVVRIVSQVPQRLRVPTVARRHFVGVQGSAMPETLAYESRSVILFQQCDGVIQRASWGGGH